MYFVSSDILQSKSVRTLILLQLSRKHFKAKVMGGNLSITVTLKCFLFNPPWGCKELAMTCTHWQFICINPSIQFISLFHFGLHRIEKS